MKDLPDLAALAILYACVFFRRWKRMGRDSLLVNTLLYVYLSLLLYFTLMPVIASLPSMLHHPYRPMNLIPFIDVSLGRGDFLRQAALNVVMTIPFGVLFPLTRKGGAGFLRTVLCCLCMSLGIELLQPLLNGFRSSDITDVITNTAGGAVGYGLCALLRPISVRVLGRLRGREP